jgi:hypothetical protein
MSVGLQGFCILFLDPDRFDLTVGGRRRLLQATAIYSRLPFRSITDYLTREYPHLFVLRSSVRIPSFIPTLIL